MSQLTDIIFRTLTKLGFTTKGIDLTWLELDKNFEALIDFCRSLNPSGNIAPYNSGTTYTPSVLYSQYVSYNGNTYQFISGTPQINITPGTPAAVGIWNLVSAGALSHAQNTDTYLAAGTANQISAAQLKAIYDSHVIVSSYAAVVALSVAGTLRPGYWYFLLDKQIFVKANDAIHISRKAYGFFYNCDHNNVSGLFLGVWSPTLAGVSAGKLTSWDGIQYSNAVGINGATPPNIDVGNWTALPTTDPSYIQELDEIIYDIDSDVVCKRCDKRGNKLGDGNASTAITYGTLGNFKFGDDNVFSNTITVGSLNCINAYGIIKKNVVDTGAQPYAYNCGLTLDGNHFSNNNQTVFQSESGNISNSNFSGNVPLEFNAGEVPSYSELIINNDFSNMEILVDFTGLTNLSFTSTELLNKVRAVGKIILTSTNGSESLNTVSGISSSSNREIRIQPANPLVVTISNTAFKFLGGAASRVYNGANGDLLALHPTYNGAITQYKEKYSTIY